ncbi:MAG: aspartate aminotransferase family protein, partial [Candidatus Bathyarchaeia archaeon]
GSLFNVHFTKEPIRDALAVFRADKKRLLEYNLTLMTNGIFFLPTHCGALSTAHSEADLQKLFKETEDYLEHYEK